MKILQINAVYGTGSTGMIVEGIEKQLKIEGHQSQVAYQRAKKKPENGFQIGNLLDWKMHALYTRIFGKQAYASKIQTKKLLKWIALERPDIVHLHNLHSNYINLNLLLEFLRKKKIKTLVTLHDCWFFTGKCFHFVSEGCEKWKEKCGKCPKNKKGVKSLFFDTSEKVLKDKIKAFGELSDLTVVGCSQWVCGLAKESAVFSGKNIYNIYNGVDLDVFCRRDREDLRKKLDIGNEFVIMGMANKWLLSENQEILDKVITDLGENSKLILVGCNEEQMARFKDNERVKCFGFLREREALAEIYAASDVFVNLTFEDTLPTVNMEAICSGTPVVTYNSCGSPELVREGVTGYITPQGDFEELKVALQKIKDGQISRNECEKFGIENFDKDKKYAEYVKLYKKISETDEKHLL